MEKEQLVLPCNFYVPYSLEGPLQMLLCNHATQFLQCSWSKTKKQTCKPFSSLCSQRPPPPSHWTSKHVGNGHSALLLQTPTTLSFKISCLASLPQQGLPFLQASTWTSSQGLLVPAATLALLQSFMYPIPPILEHFKPSGHLNLFPIRPDSLSDPRPFGQTPQRPTVSCPKQMPTHLRL